MGTYSVNDDDTMISGLPINRTELIGLNPDLMRQLNNTKDLAKYIYKWGLRNNILLNNQSQTIQDTYQKVFQMPIPHQSYLR